MKVILAYNVIDSVSGENTFFSNLVRGMQDKGIEILDCPIHQSNPSSLLGRFEYYSRFPLLFNVQETIRSKGKVDVIHFLNAALCPAGHAIKGIPKIATSHFVLDSYLESAPQNDLIPSVIEKAYSRYVSLLDRAAFSELDKLVVNSPYQSSVAMKHYGLPASKVESIPAGVDLGYFRSLQREDMLFRFGADEVIAYFGRLYERQKGISYLIKAMKHIRRKRLRLLIIGDGPHKDYYQMMVRDLGLGDQVIFLGRMDFRSKSIIQKSVDLVVIPSVYETYGLVFGETLACGVPIVAFDLPFWKGLYDSSALFVPPRDEILLAQGIESVLDDPSLGRSLVSAGSRCILSHDISITIDSYRRLYESVRR